MRPHWHPTIDNVLLYGLSAIVVISAIHLAAIPLARSRNRWLRVIGEGLGALPLHS